MEFRVRFYATGHDEQPVVDFLEELRTRQPVLHKRATAGLLKLQRSEWHGPPLTTLVDPAHDIFELRVGGKDIARVFFFFRKGREIILTSGYVKKTQKVDPDALALARRHKQDWEERHP